MTQPTQQPRVLILEKSADVLHKVRMSGGGRCNVTHRPGIALPADTYPRGAALVQALSSKHSASDTAAWFESRGVSLKTESDGRIFPVSDSSSSVVNCLAGTADALGIQVFRGARVSSLARLPGPAAQGSSGTRFQLAVLDTGGNISHMHCDRVIMCCGSMQIRSTRRLLEDAGVSIRTTAPSLFSLLLASACKADVQGLEGVTVPDACISIRGPATTDGQSQLQQSGSNSENPSSQRGPILITHGGLSGPAVLRLSSWEAFSLQQYQYNAEVCVNWAPYIGNAAAAADEFRAMSSGVPGVRPSMRHRAIGEVSPWPNRLPARLWRRILGLSCRPSLAGQAWRHVEGAAAAQAMANALWPSLTEHKLITSGRRTNKDEFVTAGGVDWLRAVDLERMESTEVPGLHFSGEVLDVDGVTGGFNFQACWSTGYVAGRAVAAAI